MEEKARWLPAGDASNPFPTAILDLMITQNLTATTSEQSIAERAGSWTHSIGDELDVAPLAELADVPCAMRFTIDRSLPRGLVFAPMSMDQKWVIAWRAPHLIAARSWTGAVEAIAHARGEGSTLIVDRVRAVATSALVTMGPLAATFEWLVRSHALGEKSPFPANDEGATLFENVPVTAFSAFGNVIFCAARSWWAPPPSMRPLRSSGRIVLAVRESNVAALANAVAAGDDVDAPSGLEGYTALHLAVVRDDVAMVEQLVLLGADVNRRTDRGMFALGMAAVHKASPEMFAALRARGVDLFAANDVGFNALHASCEVGNAWAIRWLHQQGHDLEARTKRGHTALHIACGLGHLVAVQALVALGARTDALSPDGTAIDIAKREGHADVAAWLSR